MLLFYIWSMYKKGWNFFPFKPFLAFRIVTKVNKKDRKKKRSLKGIAAVPVCCLSIMHSILYHVLTIFFKRIYRAILLFFSTSSSFRVTIKYLTKSFDIKKECCKSIAFLFLSFFSHSLVYRVLLKISKVFDSFPLHLYK